MFFLFYIGTFSSLNTDTDFILTVVSYNCKNIKTSLGELQSLCNSCDVLCLQETWLLDCELSLLTNVHSDFYAKGTSSVKICDNVLHGRPHGGTAILWRKSLGDNCNIVDLEDDRLIGIEIDNGDNARLLFINICLIIQMITMRNLLIILL